MLRPINALRSGGLGAASEGEGIHYSLKQDDDTQPQGLVLNVVEAVLELDAGILYGSPVALLYKGPTSHSGLYQMTHSVERNFLCQLLLELRPFCSRANSTHLALEDVQELGKFV